jgi:hypothetical protein
MGLIQNEKMKKWKKFKWKGIICTLSVSVDIVKAIILKALTRQRIWNLFSLFVFCLSVCLSVCAESIVKNKKLWIYEKKLTYIEKDN